MLRGGVVLRCHNGGFHRVVPSVGGGGPGDVAQRGTVRRKRCGGRTRPGVVILGNRTDRDRGCEPKCQECAGGQDGVDAVGVHAVALVVARRLGWFDAFDQDRNRGRPAT